MSVETRLAIATNGHRGGEGAGEAITINNPIVVESFRVAMVEDTYGVDVTIENVSAAVTGDSLVGYGNVEELTASVADTSVTVTVSEEQVIATVSEENVVATIGE